MVHLDGTIIIYEFTSITCWLVWYNNVYCIWFYESIIPSRATRIINALNELNRYLVIYWWSFYQIPFFPRGFLWFLFFNYLNLIIVASSSQGTIFFFSTSSNLWNDYWPVMLLCPNQLWLLDSLDKLFLKTVYSGVSPLGDSASKRWKPSILLQVLLVCFHLYVI